MHLLSFRNKKDMHENELRFLIESCFFMFCYKTQFKIKLIVFCLYLIQQLQQVAMDSLLAMIVKVHFTIVLFNFNLFSVFT